MLVAILIVTGIGLILGVALVVASKFLAVKEDTRVSDLRGMLPGANCGACGYAGCDDYAKALAAGGVKPNLCVPGASDTARKVSEYLGLPFEEVGKMKAIVRCSGNYDTSVYVMDYEGPHTCSACNSFYQGRRSCSYGCLGFGDCVAACKFGAIHVENGLSVIDREKCTGCGACARACPDHLITLVPESSRVYVACSSHDKGAYTRKICTAGCIGCMKCQKTCEHDAIHVDGNLSSIDPAKCVNCGKCVEVCPVHVIKMA